jgi:hypothetical protein
MCTVGVDGMANDPVATSWGLTPCCCSAIAYQAASWGLPLLVLGDNNAVHAMNCVPVAAMELKDVKCMYAGGGGYDAAGAARAWTSVMGSLLSKDLSNDIPIGAAHIEQFGPSYELYTSMCIHVVVRVGANHEYACCIERLSRNNTGSTDGILGHLYEANSVAFT